jgi:glycosyltransferase involved in cell wall biosynthesis
MTSSRHRASADDAMRLAVYTDYKYRCDASGVYAEKAFTLFIARLAEQLDGLVLLGRVDPKPGRWHYRLPESISFVPLPWYRTLARPLRAAPAMLRSIRRFWRALDDVDVVWLLGPHLLSIAFLIVAALRRKRVVLGARQDLPRYVASRHPRRRSLRALAVTLEGAWRVLARRYPIIVVGPDLERRYRHAIAALGIYVSLVDESAIEDARESRDYSGELTVLSVGRLEREKNPLLLADVLALLREHDPRWRLVVCGEGPMREELLDTLDRLGLTEYADLLGYVPMDDGLDRFYRECHLFLHVSWTEGMPQVLLEAFAARLPVVATAVGGVADAAGGRALLVPPGDAPAAASELAKIAHDGSLRARLTRVAADHARRHTVETESHRVADFLGGVTGAESGPERKQPSKARATAAIGSLIASICALAAMALAGTASGTSVGRCAKVASPDGNDSAPGTAGGPYATAQRLVNALAPGETGCLRAGTYREDLTLATPGVGLTSYPGGRATLAGRLRVTADRVTVERLTLDGRNARDLPSPTINADDAVFRRNDVSSRDSGICFILGSLTEVRHPVIKRNRIHDCGQPGGIPDHGIYMQHVNGARIVRNTIYDNAERGIKIGPDSQRALIRGNVIDGNPIGLNFSGDESSASSGNVVTRNVISNSTGYWNVQSYWPGPVGRGNVVSRNCLHPANPDSHYDERGGISDGPGFAAVGNLTASPGYLNRQAKDFRLSRDSMCRAVYGAAVSGSASPLLCLALELRQLIDGVLAYVE